MRSLFKTTIVIWSEYDSEAGHVELADLALDATDGQSYCSSMTKTKVEDPSKDPDWDGTEFFGEEEDNESESKEEGDDHSDADGDTVG